MQQQGKRESLTIDAIGLSLSAMLIFECLMAGTSGRPGNSLSRSLKIKQNVALLRLQT